MRQLPHPPEHLCSQILLLFQPGKASLENGRFKPRTVHEIYCSLVEFGWLPRFESADKQVELIDRVQRFSELLEHESLLTGFGVRPGTTPGTGSTYCCLISIDAEDLLYGAYDCRVRGFVFVREIFLNYVHCLEVVDAEGEFASGSSFLLENGLLVTARHCIERMKNVKIKGMAGAAQQLTKIRYHADPQVDIAVLDFKIESGGFKLEAPHVLDKVLVMGFPTVPGFDCPCVSEDATVIAKVKSVEGTVVGRDVSYLDRVEYLLLNCKIKGGSSGSPVINRNGKVVGITVQLPALDKESNVAGYGAALPSERINEVLESGQAIKFRLTDDGFSTLL